MLQMKLGRQQLLCDLQASHSFEAFGQSWCGWPLSCERLQGTRSHPSARRVIVWQLVKGGHQQQVLSTAVGFKPTDQDLGQSAPVDFVFAYQASPDVGACAVSFSACLHGRKPQVTQLLTCSAGIAPLLPPDLPPGLSWPCLCHWSDLGRH